MYHALTTNVWAAVCFYLVGGLILFLVFLLAYWIKVESKEKTMGLALFLFMVMTFLLGGFILGQPTFGGRSAMSWIFHAICFATAESPENVNDPNTYAQRMLSKSKFVKEDTGTQDSSGNSVFKYYVSLPTMGGGWKFVIVDPPNTLSTGNYYTDRYDFKDPLSPPDKIRVYIYRKVNGLEEKSQEFFLHRT
ncbi:MAG: hypothetical protein Q7R81_05480 [Candidatus Peregrinibacteria bacterium]|nr:hypothetical protein [Candidatus Peregrinibacteria bacterium]